MLPQTTFDASIYVDAVTLLGFRPFIKVMRTGERRLAELLPEDPLEPTEKEFYLALLDEALQPGARTALFQELERRGLIQHSTRQPKGTRKKTPAAKTAEPKKIETYQELQREADEIARLVSVWFFIEAEQRLLELTKMKYPLRDENA